MKVVPTAQSNNPTLSEGQSKTPLSKANGSALKSKMAMVIAASAIILILSFFLFKPAHESGHEHKSTEQQQQQQQEQVQPEPEPYEYKFEDPYFNLTAASKVTTLDDEVLKSIDAKDQSVLPKALLVGIFTSSRDFQRRQIMRALQIDPYKRHNITFRFILGIPPETYRRSLVYENNTYGDLIILENVPDTYVVANSYKTFEYFKYVEENMNIFKYVAKMDTDTFVSFPDFLPKHFNETVLAMDYAIIGNWVYGGVVPWAQGAFYVLSYKMMHIINRLYDKVDRRTIHEDFQVALFFYDAKVNYTRVEIDEDRSYDLITHWPLEYNTFRIHKIKDENLYLMALSCFTSEGINKTQVDYWKARNWEPDS